jgi:RNA polymerase sigma-70 factor, ECF subfamily
VNNDIAQFETHRSALTGHCYRMLGSVVDADDAVQETMIRAWKSAEQFDGRATVRTWLYRIATNVCLDELGRRRRRERPMGEGPAATSGSPSLDLLVQRPREHWIEPIADARAIPTDVDPAERMILRESIRLAFVAALQTLPPKQRAVLLLVEVLGWSATDVAESLEISVAAVNSALQRARATLASATNEQPALSVSSAEQERMLARYVAAFERYDIDTLASLLREDATFSMPPYALWFRGPEAVRTWMLGLGSGCRGSLLLPTTACGSPAFGQYRRHPGGRHKPWALIVLELSGDRIAAVNSFLDTETLFPRFDLPVELSS